MSNTRHADKSAPFRQERFASSAEFERGLLGNLIARRAELLHNQADRELIWWLQNKSWKNGGLSKLASDVIAAYPSRIATKSMQKYGCGDGQIYSSEKAKAVRCEFPENKADNYPLKGEVNIPECDWLDACEREQIKRDHEKRAQSFPSQYPASQFAKDCLNAAANLPELWREICLNPESNISQGGPWYFPTMIETLLEFMRAEIEIIRVGEVTTEIGRQVHETLDYCQQSGFMVLIDGLARTGKTHSGKLWCNLHPGSARYVQVPSGNDDLSFYREIARAVGVSSNQKAKAQELRGRIEDTLRRGGLTLILDEGHELWPQSNYRDTKPARITWLMNSLVNYGVPVAIITTPQFMRSQKEIERKSCWTSEQFTGRIGHYQKLPDSLSKEDLTAVAKHGLPEGCTKSIEALVLYAQGSAKYLAGINAAIGRARHLAKNAGRAKVIFADVKNAIKQSVIPSDNALAIALADPKKNGRSRAISTPLQAPENAIETPLQSDRDTRPAIDDRTEEFTAISALATERTKGHLVAE